MYFKISIVFLLLSCSGGSVSIYDGTPYAHGGRQGNTTIKIRKANQRLLDRAHLESTPQKFPSENFHISLWFIPLKGSCTGDDQTICSKRYFLEVESVGGKKEKFSYDFGVVGEIHSIEQNKVINLDPPVEEFHLSVANYPKAAGHNLPEDQRKSVKSIIIVGHNYVKALKID